MLTQSSAATERLRRSSGSQIAQQLQEFPEQQKNSISGTRRIQFIGQQQESTCLTSKARRSTKEPSYRRRAHPLGSGIEYASEAPRGDRLYIARGILKRTRPRAVAEGALKISDQWARDAMSLCGFRVRRATTDRTVTCDEIRLKGVPFFKELSQKKVKCRSLVFNLDEFFCNTSTSSLSLTRHWAGQQSRGLMQ